MNTIKYILACANICYCFDMQGAEQVKRCCDSEAQNKTEKEIQKSGNKVQNNPKC